MATAENISPLGPLTMQELGELYESLATSPGVIYRTAGKLRGNVHQAEDVIADAFLGVAEKVAAGEVMRDTAKAYASRAIANGTVDLLRLSARRQNISLEENEGVAVGNAEEEVIAMVSQEELRGKLSIAINSLPVNYRDIIVMAKIRGMKYEEIASATGLSIGSIKLRVSRGMKALGNLLEDPDNARMQ